MSNVSQGPDWWLASDGKWYAPEQAAPPPPAGGVLYQFGDITVTATEVVTPKGRIPLTEAQWTVAPNLTTTTTIPPWAVVMAIIFIWVCLLSLLFLLAKEPRTSGYVTVTVEGAGVFYAVQLPVMSVEAAGQIEGNVNTVRSMSTTGP